MKTQRFVVLGLGAVGDFVARRLTADGHSVTAIERCARIVSEAQSTLDARLVRGDARSFASWREADVAGSDYLVAVTDDDTVNIAAALIAQKLGIGQKIVRVRGMELWADDAILTPADLGIDLVIRPEELAAQEIARLVQSSRGNVRLDVGEDEQLQVLGATARRQSPFTMLRLADLAAKFDDFPFRVVAVARDIETLIPGGDFRIEPGDRLYIMARREHVPRLMEMLGVTDAVRHRILIVGGGLVGARLAELLQRDYAVRLVERDDDRAEQLAHLLPRTDVLHGDGTARATLVMAGLADVDTVVCATNDNEANIMTAVLAKHLVQTEGDDGRRSVAVVKRGSYAALAAALGIDIVVEEEVLAANEVLRFVRAGEVLSTGHLYGSDAEIVELIAAPNSVVTKSPIHAIPQLQGRITVGALKRDDGDWVIAQGATQIVAGDRVVCVCGADQIGLTQQLFLR